MAASKHGLTIPLVLAVAAIGPACADRSSSDSGSADSAATETGGGPQCEAIDDQTGCEADDACEWNTDLGGICVARCELIDQMVACDQEDFCFWDGSSCQFGEI